MIRLNGVTRTFGQTVAVKDLDLTIPPGELFAFLGPNGAGKTTTIKMLVSLLRPTHGTVTVGGHDTVAEPRQANRFVGYVPEEAFLYEKLSGREFLQFVASLRGMDGPATAAAIERQTEQFQLAGFLDDLAETYSHGMKQRLVFASALLHDPSILVVDEPTVGLDPKSVRLVKDLMRRRVVQGMTVFMSTHTLAIAEEIADRIGIINRGRLCFLGTLGDLQRELSLQQGSLERLFLQLTDSGDGEPAEPAPPQPECEK